MKTKCYAKINHYLIVKNTIKNNLHILDSVMQKIDLYDVLSVDIKKTDSKTKVNNKVTTKLTNENIIRVNSHQYKKLNISEIQLIFEKTSCYLKNKKSLKTKNNLIIKALNLYLKKLCEDYEIYFKEKVVLQINVKKNIPLGSGLGGGSSNAASMINLMQDFLIDKYKNKEFIIKKNNKNIKISDFRLKKIAKTNLGISLGSDVPFFIHGNNCSRVLGTGDIIKKVEGKKGEILLFFPKVKQSTKSVYKKFDEINKLKNNTTKKIVVNAKKYDEIVINDLEDAFFSLNTKVLTKKNELCKKFPNSKVILTGSGSTIFVHLKGNDKKTKTSICKKVKLLND